MFDKWRKYSYTAQKERRHLILAFLFWIFSIFLAFSIVSSALFFTIRMDGNSMEPGIKNGERLFASPFPYGARLFFLPTKLPAPDHPRRGDIVVIRRTNPETGALNTLYDALLRFFTGQSIGNKKSVASRFSVKRVIGIPGDELFMEEFITRIRPEGDAYSLTEFELADGSYNIISPNIPKGWDSSLPMSGTMPLIHLASDEYFLVSDDRTGSSDSRTWGAVHLEDIIAKVSIRYWPLNRFGSP